MHVRLRQRVILILNGPPSRSARRRQEILSPPHPPPFLRRDRDPPRCRHLALSLGRSLFHFEPRLKKDWTSSTLSLCVSNHTMVWWRYFPPPLPQPEAKGPPTSLHYRGSTRQVGDLTDHRIRLPLLSDECDGPGRRRQHETPPLLRHVPRIESERKVAGDARFEKGGKIVDPPAVRPGRPARPAAPLSEKTDRTDLHVAVAGGVGRGPGRESIDNSTA
jgi:hypothetical protein